MSLFKAPNAASTRFLAVTLTLGSFVMVLFSRSGVILAQDALPEDSVEGSWIVQDGVTQESQGFGLDSPTPVIDEKALKRAEFLQGIRDALKATQKDLYDVNVNVKDAGNRVEETRTQISTLRDQLVNLDQQIKQTEDLILNVSVQVAQKENELVVLYDDMEMKKAQIENQKNMLTSYLKTIYEQESGMTDTMNGNEDISIVKLLLSDDSVGEQLQEMKYLNIMEETGHQIFDRLETLLAEQKIQEKRLDEGRLKLTALYSRLEEEKHNLEVQKDAKKQLMEETKGEEKIYQQLLEESRKQQAQIQEDIATLRRNLTFIQEKMDEMGDAFDPEAYQSLFGGDKVSVYEFINRTKDDVLNLRWPVSPSRGISAYFRDASYARAFGVQHNAIDIRLPQGSTVRAPADGVVYKVRDNGMGYSYLIIAHAGGFMTTYGHISEFLVEAGEKVYAGQTVALSGGTPGTKGAGVMTTGAHLHFEVMKGGKYVDPLDYLPLIMLNLDTLPDKYKNRATGDPIKVKRTTDDAWLKLEDGTEETQSAGV